MTHYRSSLLSIVIFSTLVLFSACASSELVDIWSDSASQARPLRKILVIASERNPVQRRIWEDVYVTELMKHAVEATPSYQIYPAAAPDTDQVLYTVNSKGLDGVLITRKLPYITYPVYVQGSVTEQQRMRYDRRRSRFITYYHTIEHYGYVDSQKVFIHDIDVWSIKNDGELIWSATSRSHEPASEGQNRTGIAKQVMDELTARGIIAPRR